MHARSHGIPQERRSKKVSQHSVEVGNAVSAGTGALGRRPYGRHSGACVDVHHAAVRERDRKHRSCSSVHNAQHLEQSERDTGSEHHTVVFGNLTQTTPWQSPKDEEEKALQDSRPRCCKLPNHGAREHPPRTNDLAVAQHHVLVIGGAMTSASKEQ